METVSQELVSVPRWVLERLLEAADVSWTEQGEGGVIDVAHRALEGDR